MKDACRHWDSNSRGFTLIEILLVIALMSLILGLSAALFANTLPGVRQKAAAREIVATIKHARHLASTRNEKQTVRFDLDAGIYGIEGRPSNAIPEKSKLEIYESGVNAEPISKGQYSISYDAAGSSQWNRIRLMRNARVIEIHADPIRTAWIAKDDQHE